MTVMEAWWKRWRKVTCYWVACWMDRFWWLVVGSNDVDLGVVGFEMHGFRWSGPMESRIGLVGCE
jgi:hypothetical protein